MDYYGQRLDTHLLLISVSIDVMQRKYLFKLSWLSVNRQINNNNNSEITPVIKQL